MGDIETRLFRYFVALAEERHFSRAALRLDISPSTLSHQIKRLEDQVGAKLLDRKGNTNIEFTEAGRRFLERARHVLQQAGEAVEAARQAARGEVGRLDVGFMVIVTCSQLIPQFITRFQETHPAVDIRLVHMPAMQQFSAIISDELDVGFVRPPKQYPTGINGFDVYQQPLRLAVPKTHSLAGQNGAVDPRSLADETFVGTVVELDLGFERHIEAIAKPAGFNPTIGKRADDIITVLTYVAAGYGIAVVSGNLVTFDFPDIVFKEFAMNPVPQTVTSFVYRSNESAPATKLFIEAMRAHAINQ